MVNVLAITRAPWDDSNGVGNTMSNLLAEWPRGHIRNVSLRAGVPNNSVAESHYILNESRLVASRLTGAEAGVIVSAERSRGKKGAAPHRIESRAYERFRDRNLWILHDAREALWRVGQWWSPSLRKFLAEGQPEIVFMPAYGFEYPYIVAERILEETGAKLALLHADDYLTPRRSEGLYATYRRRRMAEKIVDFSERADLLYAISPKMQTEYSKILNRPLRLLTKGANFRGSPPDDSNSASARVTFTYVGGLHDGRWRSIAELAESLARVTRRHAVESSLMIYSQYTPSQSQLQALEVPGVSKFLGRLDPAEVATALAASDVVIHAEGRESHEIDATRMSFSTKIVDLMSSGKCILALGSSDSGSIQYLKEQGAAACVTDPGGIDECTWRLISDARYRGDTRDRAWQLGLRNHQLDSIRSALFGDFEEVCGRR